MLWFLWLACSPSAESPDSSTTLLRSCPSLMDGGPAATSEAELQVLLDEVQTNLFPQLAGLTIRLVPNTSDSSYFSANPDLETLLEDPFERDYLVQYSTLQFDDPPPADAVTAILAHELKHVEDYTAMDFEEITAFAVWYATSDISAYERETDERSLELGCAEGLIQFREWLYDHVTDAVEAQKRVDYYTPEEIRAWQDANE